MEKLRKIPGQWKFLAVVILAYIFVFIANANFFKLIIVNFLSLLKGVALIVVAVFLVMFIFNLFIRPETIKKHLGKDSGLKGWLFTIFGAIVISGPPYVLMPMLSDLKRHGMKTSLVAAFLSNRNVQPVFLPIMVYYFGWRYTIIVSLLVIIFSISNGLIIEKIINRNSYKTDVS